ncbi:sensor histidine kinase [Sporolactobacillus sp. CQH2019]|uniref:ATP-binding protein n=1 Tax=Sporolactobacillus sp. CQH2019 TaxID=3023512 RepID=UPI002368DC9D|nr:sensor histidine kinase [Sporolactobacillus sp. CQH2019]MDD9148453.1 sensor histidine kinase [Sporolactobacillus sp. CQH2019]
MERKENRVKLRTKINLLVLLNLLFVLLLFIVSLSWIMVRREFDETGQNALATAKTVAALPEIKQAFKEPDPSLQIQPIAENIRKKIGAQFIVVSNMHLIRYSHPDPKMIGQRMAGNDDTLLLGGQGRVTEAAGTLGLSIRGKYPIFDLDHHQIGVVSVGFLTRNIWKKLTSLIFEIIGLGAVAAAFGLVGAFILSGHIKKQIFNMEPNEIAFLANQQAAILESIREGIIAIDTTGKITTLNREAKNMLEDKNGDLIGREITRILPNSRLTEVMEKGAPQYDHQMIMGNFLVVVNRIPVMFNGEVIGAVASFRDKLQLDQLENRLADIGKYVDTLRSQRHEFMNKLHLISGLIQMQEYDLVRKLITQVNDEQQNILNFFLAHIRDPAIVGVLIGKMHRAKELGIQLTITPESYVRDRCPHRDIVLTILGNAIENAMEAIQSAARDKRPAVISVHMKTEMAGLYMEVKDNGPGIDPDLGKKLFDDGSTTKGTGRGFGLALASRLVSRINGRIQMVSSSEGAALQVDLPIMEGQR